LFYPVQNLMAVTLKIIPNFIFLIHSKFWMCSCLYFLRWANSFRPHIVLQSFHLLIWKRSVHWIRWERGTHILNNDLKLVIDYCVHRQRHFIMTGSSSGRNECLIHTYCTCLRFIAKKSGSIKQRYQLLKIDLWVLDKCILWLPKI